jgi:LmbE family N-acetylglucosaminyl deacetylase
MRPALLPLGSAVILAAAVLCPGCAPPCTDRGVIPLEQALFSPAQGHERVLLVVAHQDDDAFIESKIRRHVTARDSVYVVWTAYSDLPDTGYGNRRLLEAASAMKYLGIPEERYFFYMYPDGETEFHLHQIISRLEDLVARIRPTTVYVPAFECGHIDHDIAHVAAVIALRKIRLSCRVLEFPIYSARDVFPLFPFRFRSYPPTLLTTRRVLPQNEYADVLRYWRIYKSQQFPIDWYMCITVGHETTFGTEYVRDLPQYNYLCEPNGGPAAYERFLRGVSFSDFARAVRDDLGGEIRSPESLERESGAR